MVTAAMKLKDTCSLEESESARHSVMSDSLQPRDYTDLCWQSNASAF